MQFITWSGYYSVGRDEIDAQHQHLTGLINNIFDAIHHDKWGHIPFHLDMLMKCTKCHFDAEERMLQAIGYQFLEDHKAIHTELLFMLEFKSQAYKERVNSEQNVRKVAVDLVNYLRDWLLDHIKDVDRDYTPYLEKRKYRKIADKFFNENGMCDECGQE